VVRNAYLSLSLRCWQGKDTAMEGHMFGGGNWGSSPYPGSNANINPNENQFLFDAKAAPQQLQLFGSNAGNMIVPFPCYRVQS
jgi:hypothetical protein